MHTTDSSTASSSTDQTQAEQGSASFSLQGGGGHNTPTNQQGYALPGAGTGSGDAGQAQAGSGTGMARATPLGYGDNLPVPYPGTARRRGWQGEVLLRVEVSSEGRVVSAHLEKSSGYALLDDTALRSIRGWRFHPARLNGIPRADTVLVPIQFKLQDP